MNRSVLPPPATLTRRLTGLLTGVLMAALSIGAALAPAESVRAMPTPSGTPIVNQAFGAYVDALSQLNVRLSSNTVTSIAQPLESINLTAGQSVLRAPGGSFTLSHLLTNTGNVAVAASVTVAPVAGGTFATGPVSVVEDTNGNGVADDGEPVLQSGSVVTVLPGASISLLVVGSVPTTAQSGQQAQVRLTTVTQMQAARGINVDTITVVNGSVVAVTKSASTQSPVQGGTFGYSIVATNSGAADAGGTEIQVNGASQTAFLMRDAVPANTVFAGSSSPTAGAQLLYHRLGDAAASYTTSAPGTAQVDGVAWSLPKLAPGISLSGNFNVTVSAVGAGVLSNTAFADFSSQGGLQTVHSNGVMLTLPSQAPKVAFFPTGDYRTPVTQAALGSPLFVQFEAAQCNVDPTAVLTHPITLVSKLTGDTETFNAVETAANSGIFRIVPNVPTANAAVRVVAAGDGILELLRDDQITATIAGCGAGTVSTTLLIDPSGIVFDSKSNAPVVGATVQILDVATGQPATVTAADGTTSPSSVVTAADGSYAFPFVSPGSYRLKVTPPNGYQFPSVIPIGLMPSSRNVDSAGSYGASFTVTLKGGPVTLDIPLDTGAAGGLFIQKTASKTAAEVGDFVDYSITLNNNTGTALPAATVSDLLPAGFAYVKGTARFNGAAMTDPVGGAGPTLVFGVGDIVSGTQPVLTYRVRIGPGGDGGTGVNTARAVSGPTQSNLATVKVRVSGGIFSDKAYLIGKVYADCNLNRVQDRDEPGIPGVRIYLDTGTFVVTDIDGKYSLYGLTPRTYVAKVDTTTLPKGAQLEILANRNAEDAGSRFVDLKAGELHKADFALNACSPALSSVIGARRKALEVKPSELTDVVTNQLKLNPATVADVKTLPASGIVGVRGVQAATLAGGVARPLEVAPLGTSGLEPLSAAEPAGATVPVQPLQTQKLDISTAPAPIQTSPAVAPATPALASLESLLPTFNSTLGFIDLVDGQVLPTAQTRVRVKGPMAAKMELSVNGEPIGDGQVGEKSCLEATGTCALDFVGINLKPGHNTLVVSVRDDFGNVRGKVAVDVVAPGALAKVKIEAPDAATADGVTPFDVTVRLFDADNVPVTDRTAITLETSLGEWQSVDLDPREHGTQVFVEGGVGHFKLLPTADPGKAKLRAGMSGAAANSPLRATADVTFLPELRPMIAAGIAEGIVSLRNLNPKAMVPTQGGDAFEREIAVASSSFESGKGSAAARGSVFLKGKVLGSELLTLSYDSDKPRDTALFRDIEPDKFYPVYGDSSVKGFDAQSTGKLYVRLDHGTSYGVYGDFSTQSDNTARVLSQYTRALSGLKTHVEEDGLTVDGFLSNTNSTQVIDEMPANGTSGPFRLSQIGLVVNSQRVDIITRDRNQPSLVLKDVPLAMLSDYSVEPLSGTLLFKAPIPSLDGDLNPVYVRVTYEVSNGGETYWVAGADARQKVGDDLTVGGTYIRDTNPLNRATMLGANAQWDATKNTSVVAEVAQTESDIMKTGDARRIEIKHADARVQARVYAVQTDNAFNNPNSTFTAGASEYGAKGGVVLDEKNRLVFEALKSTTSGATVVTPSSIFVVGQAAALAGGGRREGEMVGIEHSLPMDAKATVSLRHVDTNAIATQVTATPGETKYTSARARLDAPVPGVAGATAFVQYEQVLDDSSQKAATVGGTYQVAPETKIYATHAVINSLSGDYGLSSSQQNYATVVGVDTTYMKNGQMFDEYRVSDGVDGRSAQAAVGLRNTWEVAKGLSLNTTVQQIHPLSGLQAQNNKSVALAGGLAYTASPDWKGSTRLEWSQSTATQTWLATAGAALKLNASTTLLGRGLYNLQTNLPTATNGTAGAVSASSGGIRLTKLQIGVAYRPVDSNRWNALARVEHNQTKNTTLGALLNTDESADVFSGHVNYQPSRDWLINGRYGIKRAHDLSSGTASAYVAQILGGRATWDITEKWDIGLQHFIEFGGMNGKQFASKQQAIGVEAGYLVAKNLWMSVGYNVKGFKDADLAGEDYVQRAVYIRLRFKFDEGIFKPSRNSESLAARTGGD